MFVRVVAKSLTLGLEAWLLRHSALLPEDFARNFEVRAAAPVWSPEAALAHAVPLMGAAPLVLVGTDVAEAFLHYRPYYEWGLLPNGLTWACTILPGNRERTRQALWDALLLGQTWSRVWPHRSCAVCGRWATVHEAHPTAPGLVVLCPGADPRVVRG